MKILTVAFFDDNYGDMLIRTCFMQLTRVVLQNLNISDYTLDVMPLKEPETDRIVSADLIVFAGGGLFGLSYLNFAEYVEQILDEADAHDIPVVFSSLGINNMDAQEDNEKRLTSILHRTCIKAMSVRENRQVFEYYAPDRTYEITSVCDPVLWAAPIYARDIADVLSEKRQRTKPVVGINVVRGGLFKDNGIDWTLKTEETYLHALSQLLDEKDIDFRFFTNGSTWDINALHHFVKKYKIPREKLIISETSREVIRAIAGFDATVAIRMHASIISYALSVPAVNFVWNPKIPYLFEKIGYPDRAVSPADWSAENVLQMISALLSDKDCYPDPAILMTLYRFLYDTYRSLLDPAAPEEMFGYETVCGRLGEMTVSAAEDSVDMRTKLKRAENRYYALFMSDNRKKSEIRRLKKEMKELGRQQEEEMKELGQQQEEEKKELRRQLEERMEELRRQLEEERSERRKTEEARDAAIAELECLRQKRSFRAYQKLFSHTQ